MEIREILTGDINQVASLEQQIFSDAWSENVVTETFRQPQSILTGAFESNVLKGYLIVYYVLDELEESDKNMLITSRLADQVGITRSVIVNGLKKCESAGIICTRSAGMKGTSIHLLNELFTPEMIRNCMGE